MTEISEALISDPAPVEYPPDRTYVPPALRLRVMQWVHELPSAGYPGINATIQLASKSLLKGNPTIRCNTVRAEM